jgi:multicomponent Na+:H+ antiporter subunit A
MAGLPPFFAFVSKEALYESLLHAESLAALLVAAAVAAHILLLVVAIRTGVRPFFGRKLNTPSTPHEVAPSMWLGPLTTGLLALVAAYFVAAIGVQVVEPAVTAILGSTAEPAPTLALWHGVKLALGLSVITLAAGIVVFAMRARILTRFTHVRWPHWLRAPGAYDAALDGLNTLAQAQTRVLQSGYLRRYLLIVLLTTAALVVPRLVLTHGLFAGLNATDVRLHELVVAGLVLLGAVVAVRSRSRLGAVAALGTVGYGVALLFVFFGAPDLAMTQFLIETLLVILFVLVFYHLPSFTVFSPRWVRAVDGSVAIAFGAMMSCLTLLAMESPAASYVSQYFAQRSVSDAHGRNVVNVILVDFRAIDTLGEVTVLAVAAIGVLALVRLRPRSRTPIGASQRAGTAPAGPPEFGQPPPGGPQ